MSVVPAGDSWLGSSPSDWRRSRIRNASVLSPGYSGAAPVPTEYCTVVPMEMVSEWGEIGTTEQQPFDEVSGGLTLFETGDVLFAKITPCMENGKGAYVRKLPTRYGFGSTEFHVLRPRAGVDGAFLYYYAFNPVFRAYAAENMVGAAGQKRVSSRFLKDTRLFLPSFAEQQHIATYLDASCAAIDAAVTAKCKQIEKLDAYRESRIERAITHGSRESSMQPIGLDWIEQLPAHWQAVRVKRVLAAMDYGISVSTNEEGRFPVLKMGHVQNGEIEFAKLDYVDDVPESLLLHENDVLYNRTNSPDQVGKAAIFRRTKDDTITFASYLVRLRLNHQVLPEFFNYVANSRGFLRFARRMAIPSVQQSNLNSTRYGRLWIPLPPLDEQRGIVDALNDLSRDVQATKTVLQKQIDTLTAYRKSLIHECVTGQRRISAGDLAGVGARMPEAEACA